MLRDLINDLLYFISHKRRLVLIVGGSALGLLVLILVLTIPRGGGRSASGITAAFMDPDTQVFFSLSLRPPGGQLRKMGQLIDTLVDNPTVSQHWNDWMQQIENEMGINVKEGVLPWLGPELAFGLSNAFAEEPVFLIVLGTRDRTASEAALEKWRVYWADCDDVQWKEERHRDATLYVGESARDEIQCLALSKQYVLFSNSKEDLVDAIDRFDNRQTSLAKSSLFRQVCGALPSERTGTLFVNGCSLYSEMERHEEGYYGEDPIFDSVRPAIPQYLAGAIRLTGDSVIVDLQAPRPDALTFRTNTSCGDLARIVPASSAYCAFGTDLHSIWTAVADWLRGDQQFRYMLDKSMKDLRYGLGFDLYDDAIWRHLDGEFAFVGFGAFPEWAFLLEIDSEGGAARDLDLLLTQYVQSRPSRYNAKLVNTTVEGKQVTEISSNYLHYSYDMSPSFTFLDGKYLALGLTRDALRTLILTHQGQHKSIGELSSYQSMVQSLGDVLGWYGYTDDAQLLDYLLAGLDIPRFEDILCNAGIAFSSTEETIRVSAVLRPCSGD